MSENISELTIHEHCEKITRLYEGQLNAHNSQRERAETAERKIEQLELQIVSHRIMLGQLQFIKMSDDWHELLREELSKKMVA